ncbi:MAG: ATP-binding cassette domain-containing protein [Bacteriovoracaceae bacterium]|nr:ATP-binding cassette domain-containing protein [Bacteriovoracaceae bacterium]
MSRLQGNVEIVYDAFQLNFSIDIEKPHITAIFGPSGCGKSSLLRWMAGLQSAAGALNFGGKDWQKDTFNVPTQKREVGYVFQESRIFPHLSVRQNLEFGIPYRNAGAPEVEISSCIEELDLEELMGKKASKLSGGEAQRLSIGRVLLSGPKLLLLDEPLASIDIRRKSKIVKYLKDVNKKYSLPIILVTHSVNEVLKIADSVICIENGKSREPIGVEEFKEEMTEFL